MNRFSWFFSSLLALVLIAGCTGEVDEPFPGNIVSAPGGTPYYEIRLWSEDHPLLIPYDVVLDGCRQWWPNDVDCVLTDASDATILIEVTLPEDVMGSTDQALVDMVNCVPDAEGKVVLAISKGGGWIEFFPECFKNIDSDGNLVGYDTLVAATVVTHEIGHEMGMPHVERMCFPGALRTAEGERLCGEAVMNPTLDLRTPAPTPVDDLMFRVFVETISLPESIDACTYKASAR